MTDFDVLFKPIMPTKLHCIRSLNLRYSKIEMTSSFGSSFIDANVLGISRQPLNVDLFINSIHTAKTERN